jgi:hypothetical protein
MESEVYAFNTGGKGKVTGFMGILTLHTRILEAGEGQVFFTLKYREKTGWKKWHTN